MLASLGAMELPETHPNLMATAAPTELPWDDALGALEQGAAAVDVARAHPASPLVWATLAEEALAAGDRDVEAYAYARTGYHRSLDLLRRNGWKGSGPVPWEHEPNQGFLRALWALTVTADRIGETDERDRCAQFLRDSSETAWQELTQP